MVLLGRRAQRVIAQINAAADELRHELLTGIAKADLQTCIKVLARIREKAEKNDKLRRSDASVYPSHNGQNRTRRSIPRKKALHNAATGSK